MLSFIDHENHNAITHVIENPKLNLGLPPEHLESENKEISENEMLSVSCNSLEKRNPEFDFSSDEIQIFVKVLSGKTITIKVKPTDCIEKVMTLVSEKIFLMEITTSFNLLYRGKCLNPSKTVSFYNIKPLSNLDTALLLKGGMKNLFKRKFAEKAFYQRLLKFNADSSLKYLFDSLRTKECLSFSLSNSFANFNYLNSSSIGFTNSLQSKSAKMSFSTSLENDKSKFLRSDAEVKQRIFGKVLDSDKNNETIYSLLKNTKEPVDQDIDSDSELKYYQNRTDVIKDIFFALIDNYTYTPNAKMDHLISLNDDNGCGKTTLLKMLPHYIHHFKYKNKNINIKFSSDVDFIPDGSSIIECFARTLLKIISKDFFNDSDIKENLNFTTFTLENLSKYLNKYITGEEEVQKEAWESLQTYFHKQVPFKKPDFQYYIFRIDEIGDARTLFLSEVERQRYNIIRKQLESFGFHEDDINGFLPFYPLREYMRYFSIYRCLDFVVAGKNGIMPFMGNNTFKTSPAPIIKHIHLKPLATNIIYIQNIFNYELIRKCNWNSKLREHLVSTCNKSDEIYFNLIMQCYYDNLAKYTGGQPRLLQKVLEEMFRNDSDYSKMNDLNIFDHTIAINAYFESLSSIMIEKHESRIFQRFNNSCLASSFYKVLGYENDSFDLLYLIHKFRELNATDSLTLDFLEALLCKEMNKKSKNTLSSFKLQSLISIEDLLTSIGLPYTYSKNNKNLKFYFPEYLIKYILAFKEKNEERFKRFVCNSIHLFSILPGKVIEQLVLFKVYHLLLRNKSEFYKFFSTIKDYLDVNLIQIQGSSEQSAYNSKLTTQIEDLDCDEKKLYLLYPTLSNSYAIDFFLYMPKELIYAFQVTHTESGSQDKNPTLKISNGTVEVQKLQESLNLKIGKYIFISNFTIKDKEQLVGDVHIVDQSFLKAIIKESKSSSSLSSLKHLSDLAALSKKL
jgi:hypothetical protein